MVWLEIIGWTGSAILVWSLLQTRILRLRALNLLGSLVLLLYNSMIGVWPMVGLNLVLSAINIVHLRRLLGEEALMARDDHVGKGQKPGEHVVPDRLG